MTSPIPPDQLHNWPREPGRDGPATGWNLGPDRVMSFAGKVRVGDLEIAAALPASGELITGQDYAQLASELVELHKRVEALEAAITEDTPRPKRK